MVVYFPPGPRKIRGDVLDWLPLNAQPHSVAAQSLGPPMGLNLSVGIQLRKQANHFNILWKDGAHGAQVKGLQRRRQCLKWL